MNDTTSFEGVQVQAVWITRRDKSSFVVSVGSSRFTKQDTAEPCPYVILKKTLAFSNYHIYGIEPQGLYWHIVNKAMYIFTSINQ